MRLLSRVLPSTAHREERDASEQNQKFGTFLGVFVPCILMLFGVIIFLRLGWVVGQVGFSTALVIITVSALIAMVTTLSMAAISTNIEVGTGGVYYLLSRSLGIEVGCAVGLPLYLKQALSIAFCIIGFAESLHDLIPAYSITQIGIWTLVILTLLAYFSLRGALKVQLFIFIALLASLLSLFTGGDLIPMHPDTFTPSPPRSLGFWAIFAIFFPAMTGMESSVSLSGDVKNPSRSLPIGTMSAILVAYVMYIAISIFLVRHVPIDRLASDPLIMQDIASVPSLIIVGIWGATLSSALGGLLAAPRTLQAIAEDGIVPRVFGKTFGPMGEPRVATVATFLIALSGIYFGSVNMIAPLLTMICLICYGVLNFSAGFETLMSNPSWRPHFHIHWSIPIMGSILCLITMLMIDAGWALTSLCLVSAIYFIADRRKFRTSWADIRQGILLFLSRRAIYKLGSNKHIAKSWRPHFLVFAKKLKEQSNALLVFTNAISQRRSFITIASFVPPSELSSDERRALEKSVLKSMKEQNIQAFVQIKETEKLTSGMHHMIEHCGLGPLLPNTVVFGGITEQEQSNEFVKVIQAAYQKHCNVIVMNGIRQSSDGRQPYGDIHIWWDDENRDNSELMLVFAYMLRRAPGWKKAQLCVKAIVTSDLVRQEKLEELQRLSRAKRLPLQVEVVVSSDPVKEKSELVNKFSKHAGIVFLSLPPPPKENEAVDDYAALLREYSSQEKYPIQTALVLSSEHTPLESILG